MRCIYWPKLPQGLLEIPANSDDNPLLPLTLYILILCLQFYNDTLAPIGCKVALPTKHSVLNFALLQLLHFSCVLGFSFPVCSIRKRICWSACSEVCHSPPGSWFLTKPLYTECYWGSEKQVTTLEWFIICPSGIRGMSTIDLPIPDNSMLISGFQP